jgi:hypothetical protein
MDPASRGPVRPAGRPPLDSLLRWVREELDATQRPRDRSPVDPRAAIPREVPHDADAAPRVERKDDPSRNPGCRPALAPEQSGSLDAARDGP